MKMNSSVSPVLQIETFLCFIYGIHSIYPKLIHISFLWPTWQQYKTYCCERVNPLKKKRVKSYASILKTCCLGPCSCLEKDVLPEGHEAQICFLMEVSHFWNYFPQINFPLSFPSFILHTGCENGFSYGIFFFLLWMLNKEILLPVKPLYTSSLLIS